MASTVRSAATFSFPTSKRLACDRCRQQKLRCPTRANSSEACARCVRAGAECVTGYGKPLGRLSRSRNTISHLVDKPPATGEEGTDAPESTTHPAEPWAADSTMLLDCAPDPYSSWDMPEDITSRIPMSSDLDALSHLFDPTMLRDPTSTLMHRPVLPGGDRYDPAMAIGADELPLPYTPPDSSGATMVQGPASVRDSTSDDWSHRSSVTSDRPRSDVAWELQVSQLSLDLCRQVQRCTELGSVEVADAFYHGNGISPFGDALQSMVGFVSILQEMSHQSSHSTAGEAPRSLRISLACALNVLSCYLRLITVFEHLFAQFHYQLTLQSHHGSPSSSGSSPRRGASPAMLGLPAPFSLSPHLPGLTLAGLPIQHSSLQAKILVQTVEHHFELMERLLALPSTLRVSGRREPAGSVMAAGLWDEETMRGLLSPTSAITTSELGATVDSVLSSATASAPSHVASDTSPPALRALRKHMVDLRQLLDM